jgi:hypothetical protein
VQSLLPQREQVVILAASFTFFPHWLHFGTSPPPFPFLPPKKDWRARRDLPAGVPKDPRNGGRDGDGHKDARVPAGGEDQEPARQYWARGGRYLHRVGRNERTLQVLEFLDKIAAENPSGWIRPSKIARVLGPKNSYARVKFKRAYVDARHGHRKVAPSGGVYRINDYGRWKLEEMRKKLRGWWDCARVASVGSPRCVRESYRG